MFCFKVMLLQGYKNFLESSSSIEIFSSAHINFLVMWHKCLTVFFHPCITHLLRKQFTALNIWYLWVICHHFFSPGIKFNEFGLGLGLVTTFFKIYSLGGHSCNTNPNPNPNSF